MRVRAHGREHVLVMSLAEGRTMWEMARAAWIVACARSTRARAPRQIIAATPQPLHRSGHVTGVTPQAWTRARLSTEGDRAGQKADEVVHLAPLPKAQVGTQHVALLSQALGVVALAVLVLRFRGAGFSGLPQSNAVVE